MSELPASTETRNRLLTAAAMEILDVGYAGASLAKIAARIGHTKGSLGYHFPTKETILDALLERCEETDQRAAERAETAFPDSPMRQLLAFIASYSFISSIDPATAAASLLAHDPSVPYSYGRATHLLWQQRLEGYLDAAQQQEGYQFTVSTKVAAQRILVAVTGFAVTARFYDDDEPQPRLSHLKPCLAALPVPDVDSVIADVKAADFFFQVDPSGETIPLSE